MSAELLTLHFTYNHGVLKQNLASLDHADSLVQPPTGNCLNWVLGHILSSRSGFLPILGAEALWSKEEKERYGRGSAPITTTAEAIPLGRMVEDLDRSQEILLASLGRLSEEQLTAPAPFSPFQREDETLASLLVVFAFHEAYHAGQTGLLRRLTGKEGAIS